MKSLQALRFRQCVDELELVSRIAKVGVRKVEVEEADGVLYEVGNSGHDPTLVRDLVVREVQVLQRLRCAESQAQRGKLVPLELVVGQVQFLQSQSVLDDLYHLVACLKFDIPQPERAQFDYLGDLLLR